MRNDYDAGNQEFDDEDYGSDGLRWMSVVVVLLVVLGFFSLAWYAYRTGGQTPSGDGIPVVEAAGGVLKEKPVDPGGMNFPNRDKTIYGAMEKGGTAAAPVEHLTEAPEEPVVERGGVAVKEAPHTSVYRKEEGKTSAAAATAAPEEGNDAIVAQVNQYEQEMAVNKAIDPSVKMVVPDHATPTDAVTSAPKVDTAKEVEAKLQAELQSEAAQNAVKSAQENAQAVASSVSTTKEAVVEDVPVAVAPVPETPPQTPAPEEVAQQQVLTAKIQAEKLAAKQVMTPASVKKEKDAKAVKEEKSKPVAVSSGTAQIQLTAARSREDAEKAWKAISTKHVSLLGGVAHAIVTVEVQGKGTFYRVRATGLSSQSAASLCGQLKGRGQDCMVVK